MHKRGYHPGRGYIGKTEVTVTNYLFQSKDSKAYEHSTDFVKTLLGRKVSDHFESSQRLTRFLRARDLTFQKTARDGSYRIFSVPVTTTVVPLPKSLFNQVEVAAQILVYSLRRVLQSIYGSESIEASPFVQSLNEQERKTFLDATLNSPHYLPQLHHPNMKEYPFFDNVGLDLVLSEDGLSREDLSKGMFPFRILELNAGSPSGASNNLNILEGLGKEDPEILKTLGNVLPNDHFDVLKATFESLGRSWTGVESGVQVIIPPGGSNGATPEIHQLSAYSGLFYCDPGQLYVDSSSGYVRLRTVGGQDPIVNSIYSRVNSDSVLFDVESGLLLRDPENGEPVFCVDVLKPWKENEPEYLKDVHGKKIPLESSYAVPGLLQSVLERKVYLGGLNRLLDNKIILQILTENAPRFYQEELRNLGLSLDLAKILPPECLPSSKDALSVIEKSPEDWVVKAPNLSGGTGVHILMTLDERKRKEVIREAKSNPESFAYQRIVKIGRIPVAVKEGKTQKYRFANLAADIRMWVFYGGQETLPKLTHNALVRYAPHEKGPMSSIVNTSKGGGYAPFVVVDDLGLNESIPAEALGEGKDPAPFSSELPAFVGAQIVQVSNLIHEIRKTLRDETSDLYRISGLVYSLKLQMREVTSYLHPKSMELIYSMTTRIERKLDAKKVAKYFYSMNRLQSHLVFLLKELVQVLPDEVYTVMDELNVISQDLVNRGYSSEHRRLDLFHLGHLNFLLKKTKERFPEWSSKIKKLRLTLKQMVELEFPKTELTALLAQELESAVDQFCDLAVKRLKSSDYSKDFISLFNGKADPVRIRYQETFVIPHIGKLPRSATEWEVQNKRPLSESEFVDPEIQLIRSEWLKVMDQASHYRGAEREAYLKKARRVHFDRFPELQSLQDLIHRPSNRQVGAISALMRVMPYAAYNVRQFAIERKISFEQLFYYELVPERIALLSRNKRALLGLSLDQYAGECFARKRKAHGVLSDSDRFIWVSEEQSPMIQLYTIGHELIHAAQIKELMDDEMEAIKKGGIHFARFLNYYGNFLSLAANTVENYPTHVAQMRKPLYGLADRLVTQFFSPVMKEVRSALEKGDVHYDKVLRQYGSLFGYMLPTSNAIRVKALREVIPALENAKNIIFAKECGLEIALDEVRSALPTANSEQLIRYHHLITAAAKSWKPDFEAYRVIASHQYYGVMFCRADDPSQNLVIESDPAPILLQSGYNQSQQ